jgi:hypothetical protein
VVVEGIEVRTEPLGGSPLARAALAGRVPERWYPPTPAGADAWRERAEAIQGQFRAGAWYELLGPALDPRGAAAARLAEVAGGAGVVVTTGQQPGLFGGPLYTLSKALSALALADAVQAATGVATAPVFWAATDDADFAEASRTYVAARGGLSELAITTDAPDGTPMSRVPLDAQVGRLGTRLREAAGALAFEPAMRAAVEAYAAGETVGGAYLALLREILEPLGIAVLDASHAAVRDGSFQLLRRALLVSASVERAVAGRGAEIEAAGFAPQVPDVPGRSLVFRYEADGRKARVGVEAARALVPRVGRQELGPNVLLRPVVERFLLPTVAYVAGPASTRTSRRSARSPTRSLCRHRSPCRAGREPSSSHTCGVPSRVSRQPSTTWPTRTRSRDGSPAVGCPPRRPPPSPDSGPPSQAASTTWPRCPTRSTHAWWMARARSSRTASTGSSGGW